MIRSLHKPCPLTRVSIWTRLSTCHKAHSQPSFLLKLKPFSKRLAWGFITSAGPLPTIPMWLRGCAMAGMSRVARLSACGRSWKEGDRLLNEKLPKNRLMRDHNVITIQIVCDNDMIAGLDFDSIKRQAIDGEV